MAGLTIGYIIKLTLVFFIFVLVTVGLYFIFKNKIFSFFENLSGGEVKLLLGLIK